MKSQTSINKLQKYKINIISLKYVHISNNKFWINLINQTYYKYFPKSFSNNIIFFPINRINLLTLSIFHFQQKNLTLWKKIQLNVAKKKKQKERRKKRFLKPRNVHSTVSNAKTLLAGTLVGYYTSFLSSRSLGGGEVGTNGTAGCNLKKRTALRRFRKKGLVAYCLPLDCPLTMQSAFQRTTDRPLDT